jgi:hypothetical protein
LNNLNRLMQVANAAAIINDLTRKKHTYTLPVLPDATTLYLHASDAVVRIVRWSRPQVEVTLEMRPPLGWRSATEYDENGVYIVLVKRVGFKSIARATLSVLVPQDMHLALRLEGGMVSLDHVEGVLNIAPPILPPQVPRLRDRNENA